MATTTINNHKYVQTRKIEAMTTTPGERLLALKKEITKTIEEMRKLGGNTGSIETTLNDTVHKIDNFMGTKLHSGLVSRFGNYGWKIRVENYSKPFLNKGSTKNNYRYVLKNISWTNGPPPHQVFYYILENYKYYLQSTEFDIRMFTRHLPGIDKRYKCEYLPLPMNGKNFRPIEINISRIYHKINETVTLQYYLIDTVDSKLGIQNIKGETREEVFTKLQEALELVYYSPTHSPQYKALAKNERVISMSSEEESEAEEAKEEPGDVDQRVPGEPSGEDYHDVDSNSIPEENPDVTGEVVPQSVYDPDHDGDVDTPGVPDSDLLPSGESPDVDPDHDGDVDIPGQEDHDADDVPGAKPDGDADDVPEAKANEGEEEEGLEAHISHRGNTLIFS